MMNEIECILKGTNEQPCGDCRHHEKSKGTIAKTFRFDRTTGNNAKACICDTVRQNVSTVKDDTKSCCEA